MKAKVILTISSKNKEGISEIKELQQAVLCGAFQREIGSTANVKIKATFNKIED